MLIGCMRTAVAPGNLAPFVGLGEQLCLGVGVNCDRSQEIEAVIDQLLGAQRPLVLSRVMMSLTPGNETSPIFSAIKLMRAINEPLLIHSLPVCQPSTDGGLRRSWPI